MLTFASKAPLLSLPPKVSITETKSNVRVFPLSGTFPCNLLVFYPFLSDVVMVFVLLYALLQTKI